MRHKYFFFTFLAAAMLLLTNLAVSAQTGQLFGEVMMQQANGTPVPVAGAIIDVYRVDVTSKYQTKTDKQGKFVFAGLPYTGMYVIAASAPNANPDVLGNVLAGRDQNYKITLSAGDGRRYTEAEAKAAASGGAPSSGGGKESAEDRKKREEIEAKNREIMAANEKNTKINEVVGRAFKAGNEALQAKRYDEAITHYDEGLAADTQQPAILTNKSVALRLRGVERYNAAITSTDDAAKSSGLEAAKKDFREAAEASTKAVEVIKTMPVPTEPAAAVTNYNSNKYFALASHAEAMRLLVTKVDQSQADAGLTAFTEYIAVETAPEKKAKAQADVAQMLLDAGASDKAFAEAQKILADNPENVDAMLIAGLALFQSGDKAKFQEAANYLQRFVDKAPETHKLRASAKDALDYLKSAENVKPQKTTTTTGGRRRG
jgi:tetratricopeptide (TPR) repeat protein